MVALRAITWLVGERGLGLFMFFQYILVIVAYYFDATMLEKDLLYCRHVLLYRPGMAHIPPWLRDQAEAEKAAREICVDRR